MIVVRVLLIYFFLIIVSCTRQADSDRIILRVTSKGKIDFANYHNLSVISFSKALDEWRLLHKKIDDNLPVIYFEVDGDSKMHFVNDVKDILRQHEDIVIGVLLKLPPKVRSSDKIDYTKLRPRNLMKIEVAPDGLYRDSIKDGNSINMLDLKALSIEFIRGSQEDDHLPLLVEKELPVIGKELCNSYHIFMLIVSDQVEYEYYQRVKSQIKSAYLEVWDDYSMKHFERKYEDLNTDEQLIIELIIPYVLGEDYNDKASI